MIVKILDRLEEVLIGTLMAAATVITFATVVHRFLSGIPALQDYTDRLDFGWSQKLCIYMFIWVAKFGAAYGVRTGIHVGVDVLVNRLPPKPRRAMVLLSLVAGALFTGIVGSLGASFVWRIGHTDQTTPDMEILVWIVTSRSARLLPDVLPLPPGRLGFPLRTGHLPARDHAHVDGVETVEGIDPIQLGREGARA